MFNPIYFLAVMEGEAKDESGEGEKDTELEVCKNSVISTHLDLETLKAEAAAELLIFTTMMDYFTKLKLKLESWKSNAKLLFKAFSKKGAKNKKP